MVEEEASRPFTRDFEEPWNLLTVDLDRLVENWDYVRSLLARRRALYAVAKSDAYGHGIEEVGKALAAAGCRHFAVESPQEGIQLRRLGIGGEILLLNPIPEWLSEISVYYDLSVTVIHPSILEELQQACLQHSKRCRVHLNVNVGLHRMGIAPSKLLRVARQIESRPELELEGLMAQPRDHDNAIEGFHRLNRLYDMLGTSGIEPRRLHFANSTNLMTHPETAADGARIGILLYGVMPPEHFGIADLPLGPVMSLTTRVVQVRELPRGSRIGYRARKLTERDSLIGTLPLGYSHGLDRKLDQGGYVLVRGQKAPFIGAISMNSSTIDLTEIKGARLDDPVTVVGTQDGLSIHVNDLAGISGTIAAELLVRFGTGIARRYRSGEHREVRRRIRPEAPRLEDYEIRVFFSEKDLPEELNTHDLVAFLRTHLVPYEDPEDVIRKAIDYSLSSYVGTDGFVVLATRGGEILGLLTCTHTNTAGFIPENVIGYVCVHEDFRRMGVGRLLVVEALGTMEGDFKLHVRRTNPARAFYEKLGFTNDYLDMRYVKGNKAGRWQT